MYREEENTKENKLPISYFFLSLSKMEKENPPQILSPSSSGRRRRSTDSPSPEFEFWMIRNPSFPQPDLVSADELFVDGILRPLHLLHHREPPDPPKSSSDTPSNEPEPESEQPGLGPGLSEAPTVSKRWTDIFKKSSDRKNNGNEEKEKEKEKKREKKGGGGVNGVSSAELNINIWPFFRSRSAGSGGSRPRMAAANRKVSSAPCSRSNSAGESKSRKWPSSPSRGGVHLGRSSPVWQVRRAGASGGALGGRGSEAVVRNAEKGFKKEVNETRRSKTTAVPSAVAGGGGAKAKVLNLNVPTCIGYRSHLSCRSDEIESSAVSVVSGGNGGAGGHSGGVGSGDGGRGNNNLFNLRGLFTKKVY